MSMSMPMSGPERSGHSSHNQACLILSERMGSCVSHHSATRSNCLPLICASGEREASSATKLVFTSLLTRPLSHMGVIVSVLELKREVIHVVSKRNL